MCIKRSCTCVLIDYVHVYQEVMYMCIKRSCTWVLRGHVHV